MKKLLTVFIAMILILSGKVYANMDNSKVELSNKNDLNYSSYNTNVQLPQTNAFDNNYQTTNTIKGLTPSEKIFNSEKAIETGHILKQVGYDIFNSTTSTGGNTTGKYDSNYKLSIGESVNIYLYGDSVDVMAISGASLLSPVIKTEVDSK